MIKLNGVDFPEITIGVIVGREDYLDEMRRSVGSQVYPADIQYLEIDNLDRSKTIGQCFNEIAREAKYEYIFFMGDDDVIDNWYLFSMMAASHNADDRAVCITSGLTLFGDNRPVIRFDNKFPTGIWRKSFLLQRPFDETLKSQVDSEMLAYVSASDLYSIVAVGSNCGYYYRQHKGNVSGDKYKAWKKEYKHKLKYQRGR